MPTDLAVKFWKEWIASDGVKRETMLRKRVNALFKNESETTREMIIMVLYDFTGDLEQYLNSEERKPDH